MFSEGIGVSVGGEERRQSRRKDELGLCGNLMLCLIWFHCFLLLHVTLIDD